RALTLLPLLGRLTLGRGVAWPCVGAGGRRALTLLTLLRALALLSLVRSLALLCAVRLCVRLGTVRLGTVRLGTVRLGTVRLGTVRLARLVAVALALTDGLVLLSAPGALGLTQLVAITATLPDGLILLPALRILAHLLALAAVRLVCGAAR